MPGTSAKQSTKKLTSKDAYEQFIEHKKLRYTVTDKFYNDHIVDKASSNKDVLEVALNRYVKTNGTISKSSSTVLNKSELINKVKNSSNKRASIHQRKQQLTVKIKVERSTIDIERLNVKDKHRYKDVKECKIGRETVYLLPHKDKKQVDINVVGNWKPLTGEVEIYHYDAGAALKEHEMLSDYLVWETDESGKPSYPKATK